MRRHAESAGRAERMLGAIIVAQALTRAVSGPRSSPEYLPLRVAEAEGHFAKEGLVVTLKTTRAEPGAAEALAQGQADLVATSLEAMLRFGPRTAKQAPRLVLGLTAAPPVALVVAESQKELVRSLEHLPGTRVGVTSPGAPDPARLPWLAARAGVSAGPGAAVTRGGRGAARRRWEARRGAGRALHLRRGAAPIPQVRETLTMIRAHVVLPATALVPSPEELLYAVSRRAVKPPAAAR